MKTKLVKLVRDKAGRAGDTIHYGPIHPEHEFAKALRRKLIEEAVEYLEHPCAEELADVLEVARELAHADLGLPLSTIESVAQAKRRERGGFYGGVGMYVTGVER
jgi:predicted house-cleaning noncanonical NTP pyrophosphatase (MazG superfamily)